MYGFSIDSDRPGYMKLCFLNKSTKDGGVISTWVGSLPDSRHLLTDYLNSPSRSYPALTS